MNTTHRRLPMPLLAVLLLLGCLMIACAPNTQASTQTVLRLATTTSTADSGLLDAILPDFEQQHGAQVDVVAVGTGQALALGERGDADVVLVHAREKEEAFVAAGHGTERIEVMYNDFVLVGPPADPAGVRGASTVSEALARIAARGVPFASRGDESGTHSKEKSLWARGAGLPSPESGWYKSLGQGMGETLITANELGAYTLTDRGTFLAMQEELPALVILFGGGDIASNPDPALRNAYSVIPVNPAAHPDVNHVLAEQFVEWLVRPETQAQIGAFGRERFGQPLFYPLAVP